MFVGSVFNTATDMAIGFSSQDTRHEADGRKFDKIHLEALMLDRDEVDELIDWLKIAREGLPL